MTVEVQIAEEAGLTAGMKTGATPTRPGMIGTGMIEIAHLTTNGLLPEILQQHIVLQTRVMTGKMKGLHYRVETREMAEPPQPLNVLTQTQGLQHLEMEGPHRALWTTHGSHLSATASPHPSCLLGLQRGAGQATPAQTQTVGLG